MAYNYQQRRQDLFTEDGLTLFVAFRDQVQAALAATGAFRMGSLGMPPGIGACDGQDLHACVDMMIERGELHEVTKSDVMGQNRVFRKTGEW